MTGNQKIILAGLNVHILGDLSVRGGVNYTITAETRIDSGILELGGGNITEINSISEWNPGYTVIGVTTPHQLVINDVVRISHSIPDIDGEYTVAQIPSNLQFVITKLTPINLSGAEGSAEGQVHSRLVSNMSGDGGIQVNWHTGMVPNTGGSRTAFFGVDRSTLRFIYIPEATRTPLDTFEGEFGDIQMKNFIGQGLAVSNLLAPLDAGNYLVKMGNATIGGGKINATPIGAETRNVGYFTNLVTQNLVVESGGLVSGFNADLLDGYDSSAFILRDGTFQLTANWYAGNVFIRSAFLESTTLEQNSVVFSGSSDGRLKTSSSFKFQDDVLAVPKILVQQVLGDVSFNDNTLSHLTIVSGNIYNSNISISPDKVFDASNGTVIFTNDQISGNWISGGTADINISGTAKFVENGIYTNDFGANTLLKADVDHQPLPLQVDEATLVGRLAGDHIRALNPTEVKNLLNVESPSPTSVYNQDALLRSGHLEMSEGGTMRGLFFESFEKISIQTDQDRDLDMDKQISFINVLFSALRDEAIINLDDGYADCHHKKIIITTLPKNKTLRLRGKIRAPLADEFIDLVFRFSGQSTSLVWEHTIGAWFIINTGADTEISI